MEEVLETFADNIAAMVIAASRENAEFTQIVEGAHSMKRAVTAMAAGTRKTAQSPAAKPDAKAVMLQTADELEDTGAALVIHAQAARDAPNMAVKVQAQRDTVKVAKDILQKVVLAVMLEDQLNIELLTESAKRVNDVTGRVNSLVSADQFVMLIPEAKAVHQDFLRRAARRIEICKKGSDLREELEMAVGDVQRATPKHLLAAQAKFTGQGGPDADSAILAAGQELDEAVDRVLRIVREIFDRNAQFIGAAFAFRAPTTGKEDKLRLHAAALEESAEQLMTAVKGGDEAQVDDALRAFLQETSELLQSARAAAIECTDPVRRAHIEAAAEELAALLPRIAELSRYCAEHPEDAAAAAELEALLERAKQLGSILCTATQVQGVDNIVAANADIIDETQMALQRAVMAGNEALAEALFDTLDKHLARHEQLLEAMLVNESDPEKKKAISVALAEIREQRPRIAAAMRKYLRDPKSIQNQKDFADALGRMKTAVGMLTPPHVALAETNRQFAHEVDALTATCDEKKPGFQQAAIAHTKTAAGHIQKMKAQAADCASLSSDPVRHAQIDNAVAGTNNLMARLILATKTFIANPDSSEAAAQLHVAATNAKAGCDDLARTVKPTPEETAAFRQRMAGIVAELAPEPPEPILVPEVVSIVKEPEPEPVVPKNLVVEGPRNERIYQAALQVETNAPEAPSDQTTPLGKLLFVTHEIAELMAKLSAFAANGDKQGMISTAQEIARKIKLITAQSRIIGNTCTDKYLKSDVLNYSRAAENHAIQLKIMAAVKAGSEDDDTTAEDQLVTAATGLAGAVVSTANSCQSASVHKSVRESSINL